LLESGARDRREFLLRPDLGRRLAPASLEILRQDPPPAPDFVIIISDGLSALAANSHAVATAAPLLENLAARGWNVGPVVVVPFGRVKLQDEIGHALGACFTLMLLGERPGLGAPDSLGAYFTAHPSPEKTDADRNCISNIRPEGLPPAAAAAKLAWLLMESRRTGLCGVSLKDCSDSDPNLLAGGGGAGAERGFGGVRSSGVEPKRCGIAHPTALQRGGGDATGGRGGG
jgi:ethanolamine ammonia-lyase small subunit